MSNLGEGFKLDKSEYTKIYDDKDYLLVVPHTHTASCKYGANTKWCTTKRNDDTDFEEHITMGVLVYLIIKNPDIHKNMSSEKFGLYRVNGYELKDLIVYDELNNEHLDGHKYLQNEFEKSDRDVDYWKILSSFNEYYKSMSIENITNNKPEKLNENIDIEVIKDMCLRKLFKKEGGFGNLSKKFVVYHTKGGKLVDIEEIGGSVNVPFRLGDDYSDVQSWAEEKGFVMSPISKRNRIQEQDENTEDTPSVEPSLYNLAVALYTKKDEELIDQLVSDHRKEYDNHLYDYFYENGKPFLTYKFEDKEDWYEYFTDGMTDGHWDVCSNSRYGCEADYEYYTDSVYNDVTDEAYHMINLKPDEVKKLCNALIEFGFTLENYTPETKFEGNWISDSLSHELKTFLKNHFPKLEEEFSEAYQDAAVESYAEGFRDEQLKVINAWENSMMDMLGMVEEDEFEEYHISVASMFKYLVRPSAAKSDFQNLIEKTTILRNSVGSGADVFHMSEGRYEYQKDEPFEALRVKYNDLIEDFINDTLKDETIKELFNEMNRETEILNKFGFTPINVSIDELDNAMQGRWNQVTNYDSFTDNIVKKFKIKPGNVFKTPNTNQYVVYYGYTIESEGHIVYIQNPNYDSQDWRQPLFLKRVIDVKDVVSLKNQGKLDLNEIQDLSIIKEQSNELMGSYYKMMSDLTKYYGEDNVDLIGKPAKIHIYKNNTVTWDGENLNFKINGKSKTVKVEEFSTKDDIDYPSVSNFSSVIPKTKKEVKSKYDLVDGTTLRASQSFWDNIKKDEGLAGGEGKPSLKAYKLGDGRITIGWGHTGALSEPKPKMGDTITQSLAQKYLQNDATEAANCVRRILSEWKNKGLKSYMITQNMFDVMVSLVFNAGCEGLRTSKFIQYVKRQDYKGAANILPNDTTMINGKFSSGLTARRKRESEKFLK